MHIGIVACRPSTGTSVHEAVKIDERKFGGPKKALEHVGKQYADKLTKAWVVELIHITERE
jgi:hypothetical protein